MPSKKTKKRSGGYDYGDAAKQAEQQSSGGISYMNVPENMKIFRPEGGKTYRLKFYGHIAGKRNLFQPKGKVTYECSVYVHKNVGPNNEWLLCPAKHANESCAICNHLSTLPRASTDAEKKERGQFYFSHRQVFVIKDMDNPSAGRQLFDISNFAFGKLLNDRIISKPERKKFFFPKGGSILECKFGKEPMGEGGATYAKISSIDFEADKKGYPEELLEKIPCLDKLLIIPTADEVAKKFKKGPGAAKKKKGKSDEDDDDYGDDADDDEDLEDDDDDNGDGDDDSDEDDDDDGDDDDETDDDDEDSEEEDDDDGDSDDEDGDDEDDSEDDDEPRRKEKAKGKQRKPIKKGKGKKGRKKDNDIYEDDDD